MLHQQARNETEAQVGGLRVQSTRLRGRGLSSTRRTGRLRHTSFLRLADAGIMRETALKVQTEPRLTGASAVD